MKLMRKLTLSACLILLLCVVLATSASAFTEVGVWDIEPGDRIQVTVGADQLATFKFTPTKNMRCNIYQDCDQYMTLVHIAPFHMDSAQEHWGDDTPRKGIRFSMKAGVEYTMEVAMPAHFQGGTFTVYFDLVQMLPDNYFSSGASWDDIGNPEPDATPEPGVGEEPAPDNQPAPVKLTLISPLTTEFRYGCEEYGSLGEDGAYVFSPANYRLYEGLAFEISYEDGSTKTVTWEDLEWPEGTEYNPEGVTALYEGKQVIVTPGLDGNHLFFITYYGPGPVPFCVVYEGCSAEFEMELLPAEGSEPGGEDGSGESSADLTLQFERVIEVFTADLVTLAEQDGNLVLEQENLVISLDSTVLFNIVGQADEEERITVHAQVGDTETLSDVQKEAVKDRQVTAVVDVQLMCGARYIHDLGGSATVHIPCVWEDGVEYEVLYLAEDGATQVVPSFRNGDSLAFATDHFSVYTVVRRETDREPDHIPATGTEAPARSGAAPIIVAAVVAVAAVAAVVLVGKRKKA